MKKFVLLVFSISLSAMAAISPQTKKALRNSAILNGSGAIHGGLAGRGFSILNLNTQVAKTQKLERLTIAMGDSEFHPYQGAPGYFHVENSTENKKVIINFMQTLNARFREKELKKIFAHSPFVKNSQILFDPEAQTMSLVLDLKKQAGVRVIPMNGTKNQTAQLKIDLFDQSLLKRKMK